MTNTNVKTGIRFGVIATNSLDQDLVNDLWYGPDAVNESEEEVAKEMKSEFGAKWDAAHEEAEIAASETDPNMSDDEREAFINKHMMDAGFSITYSGCTLFLDRDDYISREIEGAWGNLDISEPIISGNYEGVDYQITWLGGAPLLWVLEGPVGFANHLCSPCVPNAADLDNGFEPTSIPVDQIHRDHDGYLCYVVPQDWLAKEQS